MLPSVIFDSFRYGYFEVINLYHFLKQRKALLWLSTLLGTYILR